MQALSSTLLAAQKQASSRPYVRAVFSDYLGSIAHLRISRYYTGSEPYRLTGPPKLLLRLLAPLLVASTLALFGSGVALIVVGHGGGWLQMVHAVSFGVWGVLIIVHVVAYLARTVRLGTADLRRNAERIVPGARIRRALLGGALLAGVIVALATYPAQQAFHPRAHGGSDVRSR